MNIAFIGMGIMGSPMAINLIKAGYNVSVYNRSSDSAGALRAVQAGAKLSPTVTKAILGADIIALCLGDESSVETTILGEGGIIETVLPNQTVVDFTTVGPTCAKYLGNELLKKGVKFIDAPVSGGEPAAEQAKLTIMIGASEETAKPFMSMFKALGNNLVCCGGVSRGQAVKMINQLLCAINLVGCCEALELAKQFGVSADVMVGACGGGAAGSWQLQNLAAKAARGDYSPGFKMVHMVKDLRLLNVSADFKLGQAGEHAKYVFDEWMKAKEGNGELGTQSIYALYPHSI